MLESLFKVRCYILIPFWPSNWLVQQDVKLWKNNYDSYKSNFDWSLWLKWSSFRCTSLVPVWLEYHIIPSWDMAHWGMERCIMLVKIKFKMLYTVDISTSFIPRLYFIVFGWKIDILNTNMIFNQSYMC